MGQLSNFRALKIRNSAHRCDKDLKPTPFNQNRDQFGSPQTLISAKKKFISVKLAISYYGTPLALLWDTFGPVMGRDFGPSMEQISVPDMGHK